MTLSIKKIIISLFLGLLFLTLYWYRLPQSLSINTDYGKDIYAIAKIATGHFSLLGPALSVGIFAGPYYYYLMVPALLLTHLNPYALAMTSVSLFSLSLFFTFFIFQKYYSLSQSALAVLLIGISPLFIFAVREPANGLTYLPLLLLFTVFVHFNKKYSTWQIAILGILSGVILNFDTVAILAILPLSLYLLTKIGFKKSFIYAMFVSSAYTPLILFEIKNHFVITKGFFLAKNYQTFIQNNNVQGAVSGSRNFFKNFQLNSLRITTLVGLTPILTLTILLFTNIKKFFNLPRFKLFLVSILSLLLTVVLTRFKLEIHYFFPVSLLLIFCLSETVINVKKIWLTVLVFGFFTLSFPIIKYQPTHRTFSMFQDAVDFTIQHHLIDQSTPFNLIAITDPHLYVPIGNEYRFAYLKRGFSPLTPYQYPDTKVLFFFSEIGEYDIGHLGSWEIDQFGQKKIQKFQMFKTDRVVIYQVLK
jgi:hypothetical protein